MPHIERSHGSSTLLDRPRRIRRALASAGLFAAIACTSLVVDAQPSANDKALAEGLFDAGKKLLDAGQLREACDKFEASQKLDAGIGTLLYLADCYERTDRTASAWATFREAAAAAKSAGDAAREKVARSRADALDPKLTRVTITIGKLVPGLVVKRNGETMQSGYFEANQTPRSSGDSPWSHATTLIPLPIDPGTYVFEASAEGYDSYEQTIEIPKDAASVVSVFLPELKKSPVAPTPPTAPVAPKPVEPPVPATKPDEGGVSSMFIAGTVIGSVGVAGLIVTGVLAGVAKSKDTDADEVCTDTQCPTVDATELSSDARTLGDVATGTFIGGIGLTAGGLLLMLIAPSPDADTPKAANDVVIRPARRVLGIEGTF